MSDTLVFRLPGSLIDEKAFQFDLTLSEANSFYLQHYSLSPVLAWRSLVDSSERQAVLLSTTSLNPAPSAEHFLLNLSERNLTLRLKILNVQP